MEPRKHFNLTENAIRMKFTRASYSPELEESLKGVAEFFEETAVNISDILENGRYKNMMLTSLEEAMHWAMRSVEMSHISTGVSEKEE